MAEMNDQVVKGGVCWFEIALSRGKGGLEVFARATPELEDFMKSFGEGRKDSVEVYSRNWYPVGQKDVEVYRWDRTLANGAYTFDHPTEPFRLERSGKLNLSFLRIVGIGSPEGIRFGVAGPFSLTYMKTLSGEIIQEVRSVIRDYIVPVYINLRISGQSI